jgi:Lon protease-like protein
MQKFMPIFPLGIVVFPGENLNLHIFEPRYIELINDIQLSKKTFAIPLYIKNNLAEYATEIELLSIEKKYDDGKLDIKTRGLGIVRILHFIEKVEGKQYHGGIVQAIEPVNQEVNRINSLLVELLEKLKNTLGIEKPIFKNLENLCSFDIAHYVGFSVEDKYHLLTIADEKARQNMIYQHLQKTLPNIKENIELINRIKMNGHFRNEIPPTII